MINKINSAFRKLLFLWILPGVLLAGIFPAQAVGQQVSGKPTLNLIKRKRVAFVEGYPYPEYAGTLFYLLKGLESRGMVKGVDKIPFVWTQSDTKTIWQYISSHSDFSPYIEFVPDGYYSLKSIPGQEDAVLKRFTEKKDVDLIIVMGTVAGKLLAQGDNTVDIMVFASTNAFTAGIVKSSEFSGRPNVWAHMDPDHFKIQLQVFSDIFHFKKLGVVYENTPNGKVFAAVGDIEAVARERNFQIVSKFVSGAKSLDDQDRFYKDLLTSYQELATQVDAFYYTDSPAPGLKPEHLYSVLRPFYAKNIPVFSQIGDEEVRRGALLSIARADYAGVGLFGAEQMIKLLKGAHANSLPQIRSDTPTIALNLQICKQIGYKVPFEILLIADKIFKTVEIPPIKQPSPNK